MHASTNRRTQTADGAGRPAGRLTNQVRLLDAAAFFASADGAAQSELSSVLVLDGQAAGTRDALRRLFHTTGQRAGAGGGERGGGGLYLREFRSVTATLSSGEMTELQVSGWAD